MTQPMNRRQFLSLATQAGLALALSAPVRAADRLPNILLIVADDLGYGELGCQGNPQVPTPHIDSLARGGVRFTSGYVSAPLCAPSRAGFMTGRHQARFGYDINPIGAANLNLHLGLPLGETTMAERLRRAGYATGLVGKWHLGGTAPFHPLSRGFDEFYGFLHEGHYYAPVAAAGVRSFLRSNTLAPGAGPRVTEGQVTWSNQMGTSEPPYDEDNPVMRGRVPAAEKEFLTDAWAREAGDFIRRHRDRPFFLELAYNATHSPMQALDRYLKRLEQIEDPHRRVFAAMVAHLDESVGRVLAALREAGLEEQTLIFFLSDNGGPTKELTSSNAPLSGGKGSLLEGGIRIPFMMQWKGRLPAGKVYDAPVTSLDILPTALAAAGAKPLAPAQLDGVNLIPFLAGEKKDPPHDVLFWRYGGQFAVRRGDWKLVRQNARAEFQLFNLARDVGETHNLAAEHPARVQELHGLLEHWQEGLAPPIPLK